MSPIKNPPFYGGFFIGVNNLSNEGFMRIALKTNEDAPRTNFNIEQIDKERAISFVEKYHYSPKFPRITKYYLGVFTNDFSSLVGVVTLGWGTQPKQTINKILPIREGGYTTADYYEIGKMCMHPSMPRNSESQMMKELIRWLKGLNDFRVKMNEQPVSFLYTMADGIMGKVGYVYQASNFYYKESFWTSVYRDKDGNKFHIRSVSDLLKENVKWCEDNFADWTKDKLHHLTLPFMDSIGMNRINGLMFRYIYPLNKKAKKLLDKSGDWKRNNYPKKDHLEWKMKTVDGFVNIHKPIFN